MNLLHPCWVVQKGGGFTALHAASMRGCSKLPYQVFDLFQSVKHRIEIDFGGNYVDPRSVDEREGIELFAQEFCEAEGKVVGHIPARIADVPSWVLNLKKIKLSTQQSWCKSNSEKFKIFQHFCDFLQIFKANLVE